VGRRISEVRLGDHLMRAADSSPPASAALRVIGGE